MNIRAELESLAEESYRAFCAKLVPGEKRMLGVRLPLLRAMAKRLAKAGQWQLATPPEASMEEVMLRGMLIGYARGVAPEDRLAELERFVPYVTNWSICDSCCSTYTFMRQHREHVWEWLAPYVSSAQEFPARFGVVALLLHYKQEPAWAYRVAEMLPRVPAQGYYAQMALAWCSCELILLYPELRESLCAALRPETLQLTQKKLRESLRTQRA